MIGEMPYEPICAEKSCDEMQTVKRTVKLSLTQERVVTIG